MNTVLLGYRLSPQQAHFRALRESDPGLPLGVACVLRLRGRLDREALGEAVARVAGRHEILRTVFRPAAVDGAFVQVVGEARAALEFRDLDGQPAGERAAVEAAAWKAAGRDDAVPLRAVLFRRSPDDHALQLSLPALCADAASLDLLAGEIGAAYAVLTGAGGAEPADEPFQYVDYAEWLHETLASPDAAEGRAFWARRRSTEDAPRSGVEPVPAGGAVMEERRWDDGFARRVEGAAAAAGTTAEAWLLATWRVLLQRHAGGAGFTVGVASDGRVHAEMRGGLGPFTRYLPVRGEVEGAVAFPALARATGEALRTARAWQAFHEPPTDGPHGAPVPRFGFDWAELAPQAGCWGTVEWRVERRWHQTERFDVRLSAERTVGADGGLRIVVTDAAGALPGGAARLLRRYAVLLEATLGGRRGERPLRALRERPAAPRREAIRGAAPSIAPSAVPGEALPLSFGQERLWFIDRLEGGSAFYNIPFLLRLRGTLDAGALERALGEIVRRHQVLRTVFPDVHGTPVQVVRPFTGFALREEDVSGLDADAAEAEARRRAEDEVARPFDLAADPLVRATLLRLAEGDHVLVICMHHIAGDGWSTGVLFGELAALYAAYARGQASPLPALPMQYADHAVRQRARMREGAMERQVAWWKARLAGAPALLELPTDHPRPALRTHRGTRERIDLPGALLQRLRALAKAEGATLYMVLLAAFQTLLSRWTGSEDVVVGGPVAGRTGRETEGLIGFFINTLVLRTDLAGDPSFRELLRRVREVTLDAYEHADTPFEALVAELRPERSLGYAPLCQVAFALEDGYGHAPVAPELPGLRAEWMEAETRTVRWDLLLVLAPHPDGLRGGLEYGTDLFERETAARMVRHLARVLEQVADDPARRLSALELMALAERAHVLAWSRGRGDVFPVADTLHGRFEARAAAHPHAPAVQGAGGTLSYGELNARANRMARSLRAAGVGPESRVGLCAERAPELVVGILAILKAGGAYVPLDPEHPPERLAWMAGDAGIRVLLASPSLRGRVPCGGIEVVALEDDPAKADAGNADVAGDPDVAVAPENLAYVIYTSGSTGRPRGVEVTHANVLRLFAATEAWSGIGANDVWTLFHSAAFDFSVWEIWGALLYGGRLVVVPWAVSRDPAAFRALLAEERVTVLSQTPSAFAALAHADERAPRPLQHLRMVVFGGEALRYDALRGWMERYGPARPRLVNLYGITETTVHVTHHILTGAEPDEARVGSAIGAPIADLSTYVLDPAGNPVPIGIPGELYVGGAGLARGYEGQPGLTAARFVPDPFSGRPGARLYRSGDRGRVRECESAEVRKWDGDHAAGRESASTFALSHSRTFALEYLGRMDQQVKIRGFRVEPGEVQAVLRGHGGVEDVVVADYEHAPGDRRLAAYLVPHAERAAAPRRLLELRRTGALDGHRVEALPDGTEVVSINPHETAFLYDEIFAGGAYLRHGITLAPDACVFDVGANIGLFTLAVARRCPRGRVFAIEPIPPVCAALRLNAALHGGDVRVLECGLGAAEGEAVFTFYPHASVLSGRHAQPAEERAVVRRFLLNGSDGADAVEAGLDALLEHRLSARPCPCPLRTLSQVIREHGVERIDLLKVDVEKSELEVLAGIEDGDWHRIRQVAMEVHDTGGRLAHVRALLASRGFTVRVEQDASLAGTGLYELYALRPTASTDDTSLLPNAPSVSAATTDTADSAGTVDTVDTADTVDTRDRAHPLHPSSDADPGADADAGTDGPWRSTAALVENLRRFARRRLPEHMVPAAFIPIARIPLTENGKLARRALPAPAQGPARAPSAAPRAGLEARVAAVWSEVLGVERVGRDDGFFDIGGHSLLLARVHARLREALGREISIVDLFRHPTVAALAAHLGAEDEAEPREGLDRAALRRSLAGARRGGADRRNPDTTGAGE